MRARRGGWMNLRSTRRRSFNGAALVRARRAGLRVEECCKLRVLQRSRTRESAERTRGLTRLAGNIDRLQRSRTRESAESRRAMVAVSRSPRLQRSRTRESAESAGLIRASRKIVVLQRSRTRESAESTFYNPRRLHSSLLQRSRTRESAESARTRQERRLRDAASTEPHS